MGAVLKALNDILNFAYNNILSIAMLVLLIATGLFLTIRTKGFQFRRFGYATKNTIGSLFDKKLHTKDKGSVSPFQAVTTALAGTIGTGSIAGVATALFSGGPGAIFWMWVSALLGMVTKYSEILLSLKYREKNKDGAWTGGPMYYIKNGLGAKWLAAIFAIFAMIACIGTGNATQSNSIAGVFETNFKVAPWITGIILTAIVAVVILGGVKRIASVNEKLVPVMAIFFILASILAVVFNASSIPTAFSIIFKEAFNFKAAFGGVAGYGILSAMRYGVGRGVFSNEAGLGSAPIAHAASSTEDPVKQGMWGVFEVFITTIIICTMSAVVVLTSGIFLKGVESFASSLLMAVLVLGYPMAGGMITNRRVADRAISSIVISSVPVSCYSVYQLIRAAFTGFEGFDGVGAAFDSPDLLAVYLIVVLILSVYFVNARRSARKRALYTVISFLTLVALAATLEVWAFVACGLGFLAYVSTRLGSASGAVSAFLSLLPYALILVPDGWLMRLASVPFFSSLGISEMVTKAGVSLQILADHILLGIGIGADSFAEEYEKYASTGAVYENSGNLLLEIGCEAGIFALAAFLVIMLIRAVHRTVYRSYVKDSPVGKLSDFSAAMLVSLLAYGAFSYIFADMTAFYLFFTVFGIGSSALRISKQDFDDLAAYLSDGAAADSSSIDVVIRRK